MNAELPSSRDRLQKSREWYEGQRSAERLKLVGLLVVAIVMMAVAYFRFGRTIAWGAR